MMFEYSSTMTYLLPKCSLCDLFSRNSLPWTGCGLSLSAGSRVFTLESVPRTVTGVRTWFGNIEATKLSKSFTNRALAGVDQRVDGLTCRPGARSVEHLKKFKHFLFKSFVQDNLSRCGHNLLLYASLRQAVRLSVPQGGHTPQGGSTPHGGSTAQGGSTAHGDHFLPQPGHDLLATCWRQLWPSHHL